MNILIIGNGFDLAHDLPTSYSDFLKFLQYIELTFTWQGNKNEFIKNNLENEEINKFVKDFIISAFETGTGRLNNSYSNSNPLIQEIYNNLDDNIWYRYLLNIFLTNKFRGNNWIDFESEIRSIIEQIDKAEQNLFLPFEINSSDDNAKMNIFSNWYSNDKFFTNYNKTNRSKVTFRVFLDKSYSDLRRLIKCLEIYLTECVEKIPITKISQDITSIDVHKVLSFNYTHTFANNYFTDRNISIHYLHGEVQNPMSSENNMVLGIDEYHSESDRNNYTNYNIYKKFTQRIINETGFLYRDWIKIIDGNYNAFKHNKSAISNIYILGHSLDITDKDVLKDLIDRPSVRTTIFYHDKQQQTQQIANLVKMLNQENFINMINKVPPQIKFQKQREMNPLIK